MSHVLVHVAGDTLLRGSRKLYEVRSPRGNPVRLRASSTVLPVSIEALGRGKVELSKLRVIVLLPHSLITHARGFWRLPRRGEGVEDWVLAATRRLAEEFPRLLVRDVEDDEGLPEDLRGLFDDSSILARVVQVRGTFTLTLEDGAGVRLKFEGGGPSHIFAEVYRSLRELGDVERVVFDLSQGWNHLTVMAYMGVLAYAEVNRVDLIPLTSMPVLVPPGRSSARTHPSPDLQKEGLPRAGDRNVELPVEFMDVGETHVIHRLVVTISKLLAHSRLSPDMIAEIWREVVRREFDRYGDPEKGRELLRSLIRLRKVSCALDTTMLTYLHRVLRSFSESLPSIREILDYLGERMGRGDYVEHLRLNPDTFAEDADEIVIEYELDPPLSYPLADSMRSFALKLGIHRLTPHLGEDHASPRFALEVRSLYRSLGMHPNEILITRELAMVDEHGKPRSVNCMVREAPGGTALGYMKSYIEEMTCEMVKKRIKGSVASTRDVYPFSVLGRRCPSVVRDAYRRTSNVDRNPTLVDLHEESLKWEIFRSEAVDFMGKSSCKDDWWVRNFLSAEKLMRGSDAVSPEEVSSLLRNLA
ncbi:MAG: TM1812 family CRISPR-associated protein, partial [Candidatus Korarchaeota archaeon]|nr:TM1812 family CRISPR-associated protein [Candidatus Korarchaeota archaeon]